MADILPGGINVGTFRFLTHRYDAEKGEAELAYSFDDGEALFERIRFPYQPWPSDPSRQAAFERALGLLHLIAGVSYYKACVPSVMDTGDHRIDPGLARFLTDLYVHGLGEFAYVNGLDLAPRVNFGVNEEDELPEIELDLPERALVAMGGGKDSLVSLELLREGGLEVQPICVGTSGLIASTVEAAGLPLIQVDRELSPKLKEMYDAGALNGHVPVTAINSAILLCASLLYGYRWVVFSNESSASEYTLVNEQGTPVNHQYSKGIAFEKALRAMVSSHVSPGIEYFSLLRPLKELAIAGKFSTLTRYHPVFSSCNRNFHQDGPRISSRWCGNCPKCRFTTLALAPFLSPQDLVDFMGTDLLDSAEQEEGFRALCYLGIEKPFECVGTVDESRAAINHLAGKDDWKNKAIIRQLAPELASLDVPEFSALLSERDEHCIPASVKSHVDL